MNLSSAVTLGFTIACFDEQTFQMKLANMYNMKTDLEKILINFTLV